jgi:hypothetical protein
METVEEQEADLNYFENDSGSHRFIHEIYARHSSQI